MTTTTSTFKFSRGRAASKGMYDPHIKELNGYAVGDKVRVVAPHYCAGLYEFETIVGFWLGAPVGGPDGVILRGHTINLTDKSDIRDGAPAFEDGGYMFDNIERASLEA